MIWGILAISILVEVCATALLNASSGFNKPWYGFAALILYGVSFYLAAKVMTVLPVGIVYAIWSGMGIVLISAVGLLFFKQKLDIAGMLGLAMIIAGVLVINVFSSSGTPH